MVKTPQRGRRADVPVSMINMRIDPDLKHELKRAALDARETTTRYLTRLIVEAVEGEGGGRAPGAARPAGGGTKLGFLIDSGLHARLKSAAKNEGQTVTEYLTRLIEQAVSAPTSARGGER